MSISNGARTHTHAWHMDEHSLLLLHFLECTFHDFFFLVVANNREWSPVIIENGLLAITPTHVCVSRPDV